MSRIDFVENNIKKEEIILPNNSRLKVGDKYRDSCGHLFKIEEIQYDVYNTRDNLISQDNGDWCREWFVLDECHREKWQI